MTLSEFAQLVGVSPKWVLNSLAVLEPHARYSFPLAQRMAVTRAIHSACGTPILDAFALAQRALTAWDGSPSPVVVYADALDDIGLTIDLYRLMSSLQIRRSVLLTSGAPPVRGRPRTQDSDPIVRARDWGLDLSLLLDNVRKTPTERLRQLDAMAAFQSRARRNTRSPSRSTTDCV